MSTTTNTTAPRANRHVEHPRPDNSDTHDNHDNHDTLQPLQTVPSRCLTVYDTLSGGQTILAAFAALLKKHQVHGAVARLEAGRLFPASYVLPALSTDPNYAVYYSQTHEAQTPLLLSDGTVTIGLKDQETWLHCHARWTDENGQLHCGHLLPAQTFLAQDILVELTLLLDATFEVGPDEHTHFSLFKPRPLFDTTYRLASTDASTADASTADASTTSQTPHPMASNGRAGYLVRIGPNIDFGQALLDACERHDISGAVVHGGVGSVVGAVFDDGRVVEPFVTELMVRRGYVDRSSKQVTLDISLIDYTGVVTEGCLALGQNPVLVTCELVLVPTQAPSPA